jgi:hypothetical protein
VVCCAACCDSCLVGIHYDVFVLLDKRVGVLMQTWHASCIQLKECVGSLAARLHGLPGPMSEHCCWQGGYSGKSVER